jgi:hypothetical protein
MPGRASENAFVRVKKTGGGEYLSLVENVREGRPPRPVRHGLAGRASTRARVAIDPAKVEADAPFDGMFVLRPSLSMPALAVMLRKELLDRLAACGGGVSEWQCIIDDLLDLSAVEVDRMAAARCCAPHPSVDPICRALGGLPCRQSFRRCRQTRQVFPRTGGVVPKIQCIDRVITFQSNCGSLGERYHRPSCGPPGFTVTTERRVALLVRD